MNKRFSQNISASLVIMATFASVEWVWFKDFSLYGLFAVSLLAVFFLSRALRSREDAPWPLLSPPDPYPAAGVSGHFSFVKAALLAASTLFLVLAYRAALVNHFSSLLFYVVAAAFCWRPLDRLAP